MQSSVKIVLVMMALAIVALAFATMNAKAAGSCGAAPALSILSLP